MRKAQIFYIVFTAIGVILLIVGLVYIGQTLSFLDTCLEARGVVVNLSWRYDSEGSQLAYSVFQFVDERTGEEITVSSTQGRNPPAYSVGQEVFILYDPQNPHNARIKSFWNIWLGPMIVTGLCGAFLSVGLIPFGFDIRRRRTVEFLKNKGKVIHGKVISINMDASRTVQNEHPWRITLQWLNPSSGKVHVFKSDHIWFDPSDFVKIGEEMEVRIDPKNPKKHWVNIDHLPKRAD